MINLNIKQPELQTITVRDFLDQTRLYEGQNLHGDYAINKKRVNSMSETISDWLDEMGTRIVVWTNGEISSGNTRYVAIEKAVETGRLSDQREFTIEVRPLPRKRTTRQLSTVHANLGNKGNLNAVMINSDMPQSVKGYKPIYKIITSFAPCINNSKKETLTRHIVACIQDVGLENLGGCLGNDLYKAKNLPLAKKESWFNHPMDYDLRAGMNAGYVRELLVPGLKMIQALYSDKDVKKVIGRVTNLQYMIMALGFRGLLDLERQKSKTQLTVANLKSWLINPSNAFRFEEVFKATFLNNPDVAEAAFVAEVLHKKYK